MKKHLFLACALAFGMSACSQHQEQPAESGSPVKTTISPVTAPGKKPDRPAVKLPPKSVPVPSVSPSYNNTPLSPRIPGVTVNRVAVPDKVVALTFDDGPHGTLTPRVLDILRDNNVKGTFFMQGCNVKAHPQVVRRMEAVPDYRRYVSSLLPLLRAWMRIVETSYLRNSDLLFCMIQGESFCS